MREDISHLVSQLERRADASDAYWVAQQLPVAFASFFADIVEEDGMTQNLLVDAFVTDLLTEKEQLWLSEFDLVRSIPVYSSEHGAVETRHACQPFAHEVFNACAQLQLLRSAFEDIELA